MTSRWVVALASLVAVAAVAQRPEDGLESRIAQIRYAPLAEQARIQGDVHIKLSSGIVTIISGHPLLAKTAEESTKGFASFLGTTDVDVTYHFVFGETTISVLAPRVIERGNAFERFFLRMFGRLSERVVFDYECVRGVAPPSDVKIDGSVIEIWVYGRDSCLETSAASLVAQR